MAYNESAKKATMKYIKNSLHTIKIRFKNEEYENNIAPAIKKSGLPAATFVKKAIYEKIGADGLQGDDIGI